MVACCVVRKAKRKKHPIADSKPVFFTVKISHFEHPFFKNSNLVFLEDPNGHTPVKHYLKLMRGVSFRNGTFLSSLVMKSGKLIILEGNISAGKTSLARDLGRLLDYHVFLEPTVTNPYLERFYAGTFVLLCHMMG
jgi:hypothetical protein